MYAANAFFRRWFPGEINQDCAYHDRLAVTLPRAGRILDLGCGDNSALARYRTADLEVWGTDFAAHPRLQHPDWFRPLGAAGTIPFRSGELDVVTSYMVMEHVDDPARFLGEIARVLKPGGVYVGQSIHSL